MGVVNQIKDLDNSSKPLPYRNKHMLRICMTSNQQPCGSPNTRVECRPLPFISIIVFLRHGVCGKVLEVVGTFDLYLRALEDDELAQAVGGAVILLVYYPFFCRISPLR